MERFGIAAFGVICMCIGMAWGMWIAPPAPAPPIPARYNLERRLVEAALELGEKAHAHGRLCKEVYVFFDIEERMKADGD